METGMDMITLPEHFMVALMATAADAALEAYGVNVDSDEDEGVVLSVAQTVFDEIKEAMSGNEADHG